MSDKVKDSKLYGLWYLSSLEVSVTDIHTWASQGKANASSALAQGMVVCSASKPALRQDTGFMVEKTYYNIAQYLGAFGAYLMPQ